MQQRLTDRSRAVLNLASAIAHTHGSPQVRPVHVLIAIAEEHDNTAAHVLASHDVNARVLKEAALNAHVPARTRPRQAVFAAETRSLVRRARKHAAAFESRHIDPEHLLLAVLDAEDDEVTTMLETTLEVSAQWIADDLIEMLLDDITTPDDDYSPSADTTHFTQSPNPVSQTVDETLSPPDRMSLPGGFVAPQDPDLDEDPPRGVTTSVGELPFVHDLAEITHAEVVGRESEIERLAQVLTRRSKRNALLVGPAGSGKTAIVEGLAAALHQGLAPAGLTDLRIWSLDVGDLMAGTKHRGDFEQRLNALLAALRDHPQVVLFIDEMHTLIGAGTGHGSMDAAQLLKPALSRGDIQVIGATTPEEQHIINTDDAFARRFTTLTITPTTADQTLAILFATRDGYEHHHHLTITDEAVRAAVSVAGTHFPTRHYPDKAIDLLDEASARAHIRHSTIVTATDIAETAAHMTGVPVHAFTPTTTASVLPTGSNLRSLPEDLANRVRGQGRAVSAVSAAVLRAHAGLSTSERPVGSFLFLGPPGVGKTETAKALADLVYGDRNRLISVDLGSYGEAHTVSRLLGAPPGYVGADEGGELTTAVRRQPHSVVLLDEADKAHPSVLDAFLQVLDRGVLTDGSGRVTDFRHTIVIMTANTALDGGVLLGISPPSPSITSARTVTQIVSSTGFRPEFLNRFDEIVHFNPLSPEDLVAIAGDHIHQTTVRLHHRGIDLEVEDTVPGWLAHYASGGDVGARGVRAAVEKYLHNPLSDRLLGAPAGSRVFVRIIDGELDIRVEESSSR